ncbi:MAG: carboxyl transferase domain-containing protein, partial [Planctomycetota bacterium]
FKREIQSPEDEQKYIDDYRRKFANPFIAAELGYVDDVFEPRFTRPRLISALALLETKVDRNPPKKHGNIPL